MSWLKLLLVGSAFATTSLAQTAASTESGSPLKVNPGACPGAFDYSVLPPYLPSNRPGFPWGNTPPGSTIPPITGVVREYEFTVARGYAAPDGYVKPSILINNQYYGPLIEANWGDTIVVTVNNKISGPGEALTIHWHGQPQQLSPWEDGVPGVSQCPIAPQSSFTYSFIAEVYGTSWYHTHASAQYTDGVFGPMVIHGPETAPYDIDLGPIVLNDYFHMGYFQIEQLLFASPPQFAASDNNLINGKANFNCSLAGGVPCTNNAGISKFRFETGKVHRLRLINAGGSATQKFTIDNHNFTVIANDYVPLVPYETNVITLGIGQRTDILVEATGKNGDIYWMRSDLDVSCFAGTVNQPHALAAIYYPNANENNCPNTTATPWESNNCQNDPLSETVPLFPLTPTLTPATTQEIDITVGVNGSGTLLFYMNGESFRANYDNPVLLLAKAGNDSYPDDPEWNVYNFGKNSSIRVVLYNYFPIVHPMHLHGHSMWILQEGIGIWDGTIVNPQNPQRRDVHLLQPAPSTTTPSYIILQWNADNPGVWPLHCHIVAHVSAGLYVNVLERPDLIPLRDIPASAVTTCRSWWQFSGHNVVNQIDSGE